MSDERDPLEVELTSLRPREPSPELERRIRQHLQPTGLRPLRRRWSIAALAGLGVAAGLLVAVLMWPSAERGRRSQRSPNPVPVPPAPVAAGDELPTVYAYRRALDQSPEALEALLDRHAELSMGGQGRPPVRAFTFADSKTLESVGELR